MKLVDIETKITAILWDDEHEQETEREMTVGEFLDEFTAEGLLEIPLYVMGAPTIPAELPVLHGTFAATSEKEALKRIAPAEEGEK